MLLLISLLFALSIIIIVYNIIPEESREGMLQQRLKKKGSTPILNAVANKVIKTVNL